MALPNMIVAIAQATWSLSAATVPALFLVFFIIYFWKHGSDGSYLEVLVSSQRDVALTYGIYLIGGLVLGGILQAFTGMTTVAYGLVALTLAYAYIDATLPTPEPLPLNTWTAYVHLFWVLTPILAIVALVTQNPLVMRVTALVFYTAIFWEI